MRPHRDHFVELRTLRHHVVEWEGPPGGRTVLLLHGYLDHAHIFDKLAAELTEFRLLAPDFRGQGDSDPVAPGAYYHFFDYVADLHGVIRALATPPVALLAHSMGGSVGCYFSGAFPEQVSHLCLLEGIGPPGCEFEETPLRVRGFVEDLARPRSRRRHASVEAAAARVRQRNPSIREPDALAFAQQGTRPDGDEVVWKFDPLHHARMPQPFLEQTMLAFLRRIDAPTLILEGADGYLLAEGPRTRRLAALPHLVEAIRVPGAGHHLQLDAPALVADKLRWLLSQ